MQEWSQTATMEWIIKYIELQQVNIQSSIIILPEFSLFSLFFYCDLCLVHLLY